MILFYGEGRLGNQIFQYQALHSIARPGETIIAIGLEELKQVFELHDATLFVPFNNYLIKRFFKFIAVPLLLYPLARWLRLFSCAEEPLERKSERKGNSGELRLFRGLLSSFTFVKGGYFQNPSLWQSIFPGGTLQLNSRLRNEVEHYVGENVPPGSTPVFVHIRRGDYLDFSSYGLNNLTLPEEFYREALKIAAGRVVHAWFVFVTDDPGWVSRTFSDIENKCIASVNARFDFALMSRCRGGILSNSTYSLCAALMMTGPAIIIGPEYWFGFRVNAWYPPRIKVSDERVHYIPVPVPAP